MYFSLRSLYGLALINLYFTFSYSQPTVSFNSVFSGLNLPVEITHAGDGSNRLFVAEQSGTIRVYDGSNLLSTPFLDISTKTTPSGEQGLLGIAFHPDYGSNGYFYVNYTDLSGTTIIERYTASPPSANVADVGSDVQIMSIAQPGPSHNGGDLCFGPDGYLYIATGDGGSLYDYTSQDGTSLLGKILRIDIDNGNPYSVPGTNPFVSDPLVSDEIWALGLRNPWRMSFDRQTGDLWISDVGEQLWEELNFQPASSSGGENYGWRCYEGNQSYNLVGCASPGTFTDPAIQYDHSFLNGGRSVTGGFVYRGNLFPDLQGYYICVDFIYTNLWLISPNGSGGWNSHIQSGIPGAISTFGEGEDGELYAARYANPPNGTVYRLESTTTTPVELISFTGLPRARVNLLTWSTASETNNDFFVVESSADKQAFSVLGTVDGAGTTSSQMDYSFVDVNPFPGITYYRLKQVDFDGSFEYSDVIELSTTPYSLNYEVFPNPNRGKFTIRAEYAGNHEVDLTILNGMGQLIRSQKAASEGDHFEYLVDLADQPPGIFLLQISDAQQVVSKKVLIDR